MNKLAFLLLAGMARAQSVDIYSEFHRVDPFGAVVAMDRAVAEREMLSPAVARNAHASFHIAVSVPAKESYLLYVVTNPLTACRVSLYKEHFVATARGWIPDNLVEVHRLPDFGTMPDPEEHIEGQTTRLYLLDLWLPPNADVARFRVEVQLKVADWIVRPMEVRVVAARVPDLQEGQAPLPAVDAGAEAAAAGALEDYIAGRPLRTESQPLTLRGVIRRNAIQDMALAGTIDAGIAGPQAMMDRALRLFGDNLQFSPRIFGSEWYLRLRDFLFQRPGSLY